MRNARRYKPLLARLEAIAGQQQSEGVYRRLYLRHNVALCAAIRDTLSAAGIDPAGTPRLQFGDAAAAELAAIPDSPALRRSDLAFARRARATGPGSADPVSVDAVSVDAVSVDAVSVDPGAVALYEAKMERLVRSFRDGRKLDPAAASFAELHAWCIARAEAAAVSPAAGGGRRQI